MPSSQKKAWVQFCMLAFDSISTPITFNECRENSKYLG